MRGQIGHHARRTLALQVGGRRAQHAVVVGQAAGDEVRRNLVAHTHVQIKPFARLIHQPVEHLQPHLQPRVLLHQPRQRGCHDMAA